jgi:hypothetical protein
MRILSIAIFLFFLFGQVVFANENLANANQEINIEDNKAVLAIQKQPVDEKSAQKQNVGRNWFCIVIQVNGKVKDYNNNADK